MDQIMGVNIFGGKFFQETSIIGDSLRFFLGPHIHTVFCLQAVTETTDFVSANT